METYIQRKKGVKRYIRSSIGYLFSVLKRDEACIYFRSIPILARVGDDNLQTSFYLRGIRIIYKFDKLRLHVGLNFIIII